MKKIIVIGAGLSGLTCSIKAAEKGMQVHLFSPSESEQSQSVMAMGGINAALNKKGQNDSTQEHYNDTMNGGQQINNPLAVKQLTQNAPKIIEWLSDIGTSFTRDKNGNVDQRYFGGQKKQRTAYAGARTGKQLITAINTQARKLENENKIIRYTGYRLLSLVLNKDMTQCHGSIMIQEDTNNIEKHEADAVVIATGGQNRLYGKISGSQQNDGHTTAQLLTQNVQLANLEMIQYHPTTIKTPVKRMLITEAARGEGGRLYTYKNGEKWHFMEEWYPELGALMPRDVVSRSIYKVCEENNQEHVYLDITHLPEETVKKKLDEVYEVCTQYLELDPTQEAIPVYPGIHYFMGGIHTDHNHKTNIRRLYAVGECSAQYHGANRLGGNSLLGAIHGGWITAEQLEHITPNEDKITTDELEKQQENIELWEKQQKGAKIPLYVMQDEISSIMNRTMTIYREEQELKKGLEELEKTEKKVSQTNTYGSYYSYAQLKQSIKLAKATIYSALERKESRGAHQRKEYPERNDEKYKKTTVIKYENNEYNISFQDTDKTMDW